MTPGPSLQDRGTTSCGRPGCRRCVRRQWKRRPAGDLGNDTLTGGAGAFHGFGGAGIDLLSDFSLAQGDHIQLDAGTIYTVSQVGADVHIDMAGGGEMILAGVLLSRLSGDWIIT